MKKIFVNINGLDGCTLHRLLLPYNEVAKETDEFQFTFGFSKKDMTLEEKIDEIGQHDILIFHRIMQNGIIEGVKSKYPNVKIVIDMDDYWRLNDKHPAYWIYRNNGLSEKIQNHVKLADYVTCTTEYLAKKIREFNKNVTVFPNALKEISQFTPKPTESKVLRLGIIGGASHMKDLELLDGVVKQLSPDVLNKVQFVLCGFDKGYMYNSQGERVEIPWKDNQWTQVEKMLTDNYKTISPAHKEFLEKFEWQLEFNSDEPYKRIWTKDIFQYATAYNEIDVLLVPLLANDFTACKSELKLIEASVMKKPVIISDVPPYTNCGINLFEKGGEINPEGNCIMINNNKGSRGWVKAITKLVKNPELMETLKTNIHKLTESGKYYLPDVTKDRIKYLQQL